MKLKAKQNEIGRAIKAGKKIILLEGAIGTSKTFGASVALLTVALKYPNSYIFVGRKTMSEMRTGTLLSFREAAHEMNLVNKVHYTENQSQGNEHFKILHKDGQHSYIFFRELNHIKDPQFFKLKSANLTCGFIDEADGVVETALTTLYSRTGRKNRNGAPDFVIMACNANEGWIKERFYNKYHEPDKYGVLPDDVAVIEFEIEDSFLPDDYYIKQLENPVQWIERFLRNNWNYGDDTDALFKYRHMDAAHTTTIQDGKRVLGIDVARSHDRTTGALWVGDTLEDIAVFKDKKVEMDYDEQAEKVYEYCQQNNIGYQNIWVDAVGEGQGLITALKSKYGWHVNSWISNAVPESKLKLQAELANASDDYQRRLVRRNYPIVYNDLRSEQGYLFSLDLEQQNVALYDTCPHLSEFKKEATMHKTDITGSNFKIESKDKVKERTQFSPDIFDCVLIGYFGRKRGTPTGSYSGRSIARDTQLKKRSASRTSGWNKKTF